MEMIIGRSYPGDWLHSLKDLGGVLVRTERSQDRTQGHSNEVECFWLVTTNFDQEDTFCSNVDDKFVD
jgi:hypothetical protein